MKRVAITGLGVVSSIGMTIPDFWAALAAGKNGITEISNIPTLWLLNKMAAEIKDFDPLAYFSPKKLGMYDRFSQFAMVAAREAVTDSGLRFEGGLAERTACILGTGIGGQTTVEEQYIKLAPGALGLKNVRAHPSSVPKLMPNAAGCQISMEHNITGPGYTIASACASATHAIGAAYHMIRSGMITAAVTGGSEACLTYGTLKGWDALRVMAPDTCRPFSKGRAGLILGEGAGVLVLEDWQHARKRGAKIHAEMTGIGMSSDAKDITNVDAGGMIRAIDNALNDAKKNPEDIQYVNAHGTGTRANDLAEAKAIHASFGEHTKKLAVSASKSMFGHALGAAGALEAVVCVLAIQHQTAPPTMNLIEKDPQCDLDVVPNEARQMPINALISNSFAFGGLNAVLVIQKVS